MSRKRRDKLPTKCGACKDKQPSDDDEEEQGEQGEETIPKQVKAASVAEALADTQAELEAQLAKCNSRCIECGNKMRLKDESADLKRRLEELEEKHKFSPVRKSTIRNVISINVISNNCSPFSDRLNPRALQRTGNWNREAHWQTNRKPFLLPWYPIACSRIIEILDGNA